MKPLTLKDLKNEFKSAFKTNNQVLMKEVKSEIKSAINDNNQVLMKEVKSEIKSAINDNNQVLMKEVKKEIRNTVKESELSLKKYVGEYVGDATERVIGTMQDMFDERDVKINQITVSTDNIKRDIKFMHQDLKDIIADMSDKPSRKQFEELKSSFKNYPTA